MQWICKNVLISWVFLAPSRSFGKSCTNPLQTAFGGGQDLMELHLSRAVPPPTLRSSEQLTWEVPLWFNQCGLGLHSLHVFHHLFCTRWCSDVLFLYICFLIFFVSTWLSHFVFLRILQVGGFDIPPDWLSDGAAAIVATLKDEHMVQLPFAALATVAWQGMDAMSRMGSFLGMRRTPCCALFVEYQGSDPFPCGKLCNCDYSAIHSGGFLKTWKDDSQKQGASLGWNLVGLVEWPRLIQIAKGIFQQDFEAMRNPAGCSRCACSCCCWEASVWFRRPKNSWSAKMTRPFWRYCFWWKLWTSTTTCTTSIGCCAQCDDRSASDSQKHSQKVRNLWGLDPTTTSLAGSPLSLKVFLFYCLI